MKNIVIFLCSKHDLDYRIACEECNDKFIKFLELTKETIKDNRKKNKK